MKNYILMPAVALFMLPLVAVAQDKAAFPKTISVNGSAEMEIAPDEIYVIVDLKEYEKKGQGKIDIETIKSQFLRSVKEIGLPDSAVSIASFEGYNNPWLKKKRKADLFSSIAYQLKFTNSNDMDRLVEKLDDDATQNFRIVRTSHSRIKEFRKQLKIEAIRAAKEKAIYLTEAIGDRIGETVSVIESPEAINPFLAYGYSNTMLENNQQIYYKDSMKQDNIAPGVDFRKFKLRYDVSVVFALK